MTVRNSGIAKTILIVGIAAVVLLAGLGIFVLKGKNGHGPTKPPTSEMALGGFIVNLADANEVRYLKADVVLEVEGNVPVPAEGAGKTAGDPRVRDAVIQVMSSKSFAELLRPKGKEMLKKDIITAVNQKMKDEDMKVVDVYFSEFAMQ